MNKKSMNQRLALQVCAVAAAAFMATGAAWGQSPAAAGSNVNLYIVMDAGIQSVKPGAKSGASGSVLKVEDGTGLGMSGSRWGLRGTEKLSDDLSAGFVLEGGVLIDTGAAAQGGLAFGRQAYVGLASKQYGELRFGRQYLLGDTVAVLGEPFGGSMVSKTPASVSGATGSGLSALPFLVEAARGNNVIQYATPLIGGFYAAAQFAPGENTADSFYAVMGNYKDQTVVAALSYEWNNDRTTGRKTNRSVTAAGSYDFKTVKIGSTLQRVTDLTSTTNNGEAAGFTFGLPATGSSPRFTATNLDGALLSAEVPVGRVLLGAQYLVSKYSVPGNSTKLKRLAFGATYALSRTTYLYTGMWLIKGDLKEYVTQSRVFNAGIRTSF